MCRKFPTGRKVKILSQQLGKTHKRPKYFKHSKRIGNSSFKTSTPLQKPESIPFSKEENYLVIEKVQKMLRKGSIQWNLSIVDMLYSGTDCKFSIEIDLFIADTSLYRTPFGEVIL